MHKTYRSFALAARSRQQFYDDDNVNSGNTAIVKLAEVFKNDVCCTDIASEYRSFTLVYKEIFPVYNDGLKACEILTFLIANDMHMMYFQMYQPSIHCL